MPRFGLDGEIQDTNLPARVLFASVSAGRVEQTIVQGEPYRLALRPPESDLGWL
jgi:hypothetical protein